MSLPTSWTQVIDRLSTQLGGSLEAEDWLREAVDACYDVESIRDLDRVYRQIVFQKASGVVLALEDEGIPVEMVDAEGECRWLMFRDGSLEPADGQEGKRARVARIFGRYFGGVALDGPPWRLSPTETERLPLDEWAATADFG